MSESKRIKEYYQNGKLMKREVKMIAPKYSYFYIAQSIIVIGYLVTLILVFTILL